MIVQKSLSGKKYFKIKNSQMRFKFHSHNQFLHVVIMLTLYLQR